MARPRKSSPDPPHWYQEFPGFPFSESALRTMRGFVTRYDPNSLPHFNAVAQATQPEDRRRLLLFVHDLVARHRSAVTLTRWNDLLLDLWIARFGKQPNPAFQEDPARNLRAILTKPQGTRRPHAAQVAPDPALNGYKLVLVFDRLLHVLRRAKTLRCKGATLDYDPQDPSPFVHDGSRLFPQDQPFRMTNLPVGPIRTDSLDFYRAALMAGSPGLEVPTSVIEEIRNGGRKHQRGRRRKGRTLRTGKLLWRTPAAAAYAVLESVTGRRRSYLRKRIATLRKNYPSLILAW